MRQLLESFDARDLVLDEIQVRQSPQVANVLDVLELVEAQVQACQTREMIQSFQVGYQVVVEIQVLELRAEGVGKLNAENLVLAKAKFLRASLLDSRLEMNLLRRRAYFNVLKPF